MAIWSRLTAAIAGIGVGEAAGVALEPVLDPLKQDAWAQKTPRVLDLGALAQLAASGLITEDAAVTEGARSGFSPDRVKRATQLALEAAPVAELLELWRRGKIGEPLVDHGLAKARIEPQYWAPIKELFYGRLDPAIIATAIQRGIMTDPGFLPVGPPTGVGHVPAFPVSPLDPIEEAKAHGIDRDRLFVETALVGLPLALVQAAQAYFRGIITLDDFKRAVAEGNTRNEWGDAALAVSRQILTSGQYAELELRGFLNQNQRRTKTDQHGMTHADSDLLYDLLGRSINVHAITTGLARGGTFNGPTGAIPAEYLQSLQRGNLRPEYYNLAYANRYTYPSAFVVRSLLTDGAISEAQGEQIFLDIGWTPQLAKTVATHYAVTVGKTTDPHVGKAQTQLWNTTHKSYVGEMISPQQAQTALTAAGVAPAAVQPVLNLWSEERALIRKQLTPANIRKALDEGVTNPATGAAWTQQDAIQALLERGYDQADAEVFLAL